MTIGILPHHTLMRLVAYRIILFAVSAVATCILGNTSAFSDDPSDALAFFKEARTAIENGSAVISEPRIEVVNGTTRFLPGTVSFQRTTNISSVVYDVLILELWKQRGFVSEGDKEAAAPFLEKMNDNLSEQVAIVRQIERGGDQKALNTELSAKRTQYSSIQVDLYTAVSMARGCAKYSVGKAAGAPVEVTFKIGNGATVRLIPHLLYLLCEGNPRDEYWSATVRDGNKIRLRGRFIVRVFSGTSVVHTSDVLVNSPDTLEF